VQTSNWDEVLSKVVALIESFPTICCTPGNLVDSQLLVVGSQIGNLTPGLSFGHNLCFRYPNGPCEPILDIYIPKKIQRFKEFLKPLSFGPYNCPLKIQKSTETPSPKVGVALGVWGFIPSHFPTLPGACSVTPELPSWLVTLQALCLGYKPKARVATQHILLLVMMIKS
jgi:hypothetical protein